MQFQYQKTYYLAKFVKFVKELNTHKTFRETKQKKNCRKMMLFEPLTRLLKD